MIEEVKRWWKKSKDDLEKAEILFDNNKYDGTVFFCQQSIEKALKALYLKQNNEIKKYMTLLNWERTSDFLRICWNTAKR